MLAARLLLLLSSCVVASALLQFNELPPATSLLSLKDTIIYVGTKRDGLWRLDIHAEKDNNDGFSLSARQLGGDSTTRLQLPIYCITRLNDQTIATGAGDRHVSIWHQDKVIQKLGPHTGWVKDALYDDEQGCLHSIGCNCIETWKRSDDEGLLAFEHRKKSSIENSPDCSTLSSDLLCLSTFGRDCFVSGGVDGRIHVWNAASSTASMPIVSVRAHQGRVNCIKECNELLFTGSHDGSIKAWKAKDNGLVQVGELALKDLRITALMVLLSKEDGQKTDHEIRLVFGTNTGLVGLVSALPLDVNDQVRMSLLQQQTLPDEPTINSVCEIESMNRILVAHSLGVSNLAFPYR